MTVLAPGVEFTHDRLLDTSWVPGPGQRYRDAPKARCRVTRVTRTTVWYAQVGERRASLYLARDAFMDRFGDSLTAQQPA